MTRLGEIQREVLMLARTWWDAAPTSIERSNTGDRIRELGTEYYQLGGDPARFDWLCLENDQARSRLVDAWIAAGKDIPAWAARLR